MSARERNETTPKVIPGWSGLDYIRHGKPVPPEIEEEAHKRHLENSQEGRAQPVKEEGYFKKENLDKFGFREESADGFK